MKKLFLIIIVILGFSFNAFAQNFKTHTVKQGETIEEIAKEYMVTPHDIYALNPDAKKKMESGMKLIIPNSKVPSATADESQELDGYTTHKVKRKETLFSL